MSGLDPAFRACAGELGLWSAARLFVNAAWDAGGDDAVVALDEELGDGFPVLEHVAGRVRATRASLSPPRLDALIGACDGLRHVVMIGVEADILSALVARLPHDVDIVALFDATFPVDRMRVTASWAPRVRLLDLGSFQQAAGARSALVTTVYGADDFHAVVTPAWVRAHSQDVRLQFRRLIGVNIVGTRMAAYPRWLSETPRADFTTLLEAP